MALLALKKKSVVEKASDSEVSIDENSTDAEVSDDGSDVQQGNSGWANSIAKVLTTSKPKTKKTLVLSRAKKIKPGDKNKTDLDYGFEVDGEGNVEKPTEAELDLKQPKNQKLELRVKPTWKDLERERALRKVATKGVVQLFNAVRIQQKDLEHQLEEAGPLDSRKEAVLSNINKRKFLDVLMGGKRSKSEAVDNPIKNELKKEESESSDEDDYDNKKKKTEWNVLHDDFMTNKKNKHWDEEDDDNSDQQVGSADDDEF